MVVNVLVELSNKNIDKTFDYLVPSFLVDKAKIGVRVIVPFGNMTLEGFILDNKDSDRTDLKEIIDIVDDDIVLTDELLELGKKISNETLSTLISAYQTMLPKALKAKHNTKVNKKYVKYYYLNPDININDFKLTDKQLEIINKLCNKKLKIDELDVSTTRINTLVNKNIIIEEKVEEYRLNIENKDINKIKLNEEQQRVVDDVISYKHYQPFLLHGVTGSGKTEVYMEIIADKLKQDKTSIVLLPEISLTPQIVDRFLKRFGSRIAILHSRLSDGEKYDEYRKISRGEVDIVIGARSAIFAPLKNIGAIIIDEEHSTTYKQENNPKYNAIDVALIRAKTHDAVVVLGSATPSLESFSKALKGIYKLEKLEHRANGQVMPNIEIVDMNKEKNKMSNFSKLLHDKIIEKLSNNEQIILFLNRRGYASFVMCSNCGYVEKCPNCDISLTYHKSSETLRCHYCGYGNKLNIMCPECHEKSLKPLGTGTEKIEEEIEKEFNARVIRMDLDTTSKKGAYVKIINDFKDHKYDILLGTQMISKGLDFPNVTLVGVINSDISLMFPNFRSSEYTYQLLSQVSGRSGRGKIPGDVIIQTRNPDHYAIKYAKTNNYIGFYKEEMKIRRTLSYSPYYYLVSIKVISKKYELARDESSKIGSYLKQNLNNSIVLGPSIANVFKINNNFRFNLIIKYKQESNLYKTLEEILDHYKSFNNIKIDIDINPSNI